MHTTRHYLWEYSRIDFETGQSWISKLARSPALLGIHCSIITGGQITVIDQSRKSSTNRPATLFLPPNNTFLLNVCILNY